MQYKYIFRISYWLNKFLKFTLLKMLKVKTHEKQFLNVTGETYGVKKKLNIISKEIYTTCINTWIKKKKLDTCTIWFSF